MSFGPWHSYEEPMCSDPRNLHSIVIPDIANIGIESIEIRDFHGVDLEFKSPFANLTWKKMQYYNGFCHVLTIPDDIVKKGIHRIEMNSNSDIYLQIYIHENGLFRTDLPNAMPGTNWDSQKVAANIEHKVLKLLHYENKKCESDHTYRLDDCRFHQIHEVFALLYLMIRPLVARFKLTERP